MKKIFILIGICILSSFAALNSQAYSLSDKNISCELCEDNSICIHLDDLGRSIIFIPAIIIIVFIILTIFVLKAKWKKN